MLLILFTLHAGPEVERMFADTVLSKSAAYPTVAIIERMQNDGPHTNGRATTTTMNLQ